MTTIVGIFAAAVALLGAITSAVAMVFISPWYALLCLACAVAALAIAAWMAQPDRPPRPHRDPVDAHFWEIAHGVGLYPYTPANVAGRPAALGDQPTQQLPIVEER